MTAMISHDLAFAGLSAALVAVPGPSVAFTISRALSYGRRVALLNVAGNTLGLAAQLVLVAVGLAKVIERSVLIFDAIELLGATYLMWLGIRAVLHRRSLVDALGLPVERLDPWRAVRDGAVVGLTNPKTFTVFAVVLPHFVNGRPGHLTGQLVLVGLIFPAIAVVLDSCWAIGAGTARRWRACSPRRLELVGGVSGLGLIGLGVSVAATGRTN